MPRGNPVDFPPGSNDTRSKLHGIATPVCPPARDDVFSFRRHFYCQLYPLRRHLSTDDRLLHKVAPGLWKKFWCRSTLCSSRFRTANRRTGFDFLCHCEEAIGRRGNPFSFRPLWGRSMLRMEGDADCHVASLLAMTCVFLAGPFVSAWQESKKVADSGESPLRGNRHCKHSQHFPLPFGPGWSTI